MSSRSSSAESLLSQHEEQSVNLLSNMEARAEHLKARHYQALYSFTTSMGVGLVVLLVFWILHYRGGFGWKSHPSQEFYWHPLFMVLGLVVIYSQSILAYRTFRNVPKMKLKILHATLHGLSFILAVIGLSAVFDSHNLAKPPTPNMYTLHSWIGLITMIIFSCQFAFGFISFLYPGLSKSLRRAIMPVHTAMGTAGFVLAIITTMTGLTEKAIWTVQGDYAKFASEGIVFNIMGLFTVIYGVMVLYLVNEDDYKRIALPEDEIALSTSD